MELGYVVAEVVSALTLHTSHIATAKHQVLTPFWVRAALCDWVVFCAKQELGHKWAAQPVVPGLGLFRQCLRPNLADSFDLVRMVQVQAFELLTALDARDARQVHFQLLRAWALVELAVADEDARDGSERADKGSLMLVLSILDKGGPVDWPESLAHTAVVTDPGLGFGQQSAPPVRGTLEAEALDPWACGTRGGVGRGGGTEQCLDLRHTLLVHELSTGTRSRASTDTGSTDTGSTDNGSTDPGSTDIGSTDTGLAGMPWSIGTCSAAVGTNISAFPESAQDHIVGPHTQQDCGSCYPVPLAHSHHLFLPSGSASGSALALANFATEHRASRSPAPLTWLEVCVVVFDACVL